MASAAYGRWVRDGGPYRDALCLLDLARTLRAAGYVVYTRGDDSHMQAVPPEDHTPFSATGWPKPSAYGVGHALDVMAPPKSSKLPTLAQLGAQIVKDKTAKVAGTGPIKYINWTTANGVIVQDSWTPDHERGPSTDSGHIHLSVRSDMDDTRTDYDPVARIQGGTFMAGLTEQQQKDMFYTLMNLANPSEADGKSPLHVWAGHVNKSLAELKAAVEALTPAAPATLFYSASGPVTLTPTDAPPGP